VKETLVQRIKNVFKPEKKSVQTMTDAQLVDFFRNNGLSFTSDSDYYTGYAYTCGNARAEKVSSADILLKKKYVRKGLIEVEDETDIAKWFLTSSNTSGQSIADLLKLTSLNLDFNPGHCLWLIHRGINNIPLEFQFISGSKIIQVYVNEYGVVGKVDYFNVFGVMKTAMYGEFIYFYLPDPANILIPKSTASAARYPLDINNFQLKHQSSFFKNNARIDGVMSTDEDLTQTQMDRYGHEWKQKYGGTDKAGKTAFVGGGLKYQQINSTPKEMDYVNSRKQIRDEIWSMFRVPPTIFGATENVNRSVAFAMLISFMQNTIIPFAKPIKEKINSFIKTNFGKEYEVEFDYSLEEDPDTQIKANTLLINSGAITPNELRDAYNYDTSTDEGMDTHYFNKVQTAIPVDTGTDNQNN